MTRWRLVLTFACALVLLRCASSRAGSFSSEPPMLPMIAGQGFTGIIVPRLVNFADSWTPTDPQVRNMEPRLQECILSKRRRLRSSLPRFFRQYSGVTVAGKQALRVDLFDTRHFPI